MSRTMTWNYIGEADITIGEVHASPIPKILTALVLSLITTVGVIGFIKKDYIYDKFNNPHLVLSNENITVQYQSEFNALDYIDKNKTLKYDAFVLSANNIEENFSYAMSYDSNVNTNIPGQYTVVYKSKNHILENETILNVTVLAPIDNEAPIIALTKDEIALYYNSENIKNFDPIQYISSIKDNESSEDFLNQNLSYEISENNNAINLSDIHNLYIDTSDLNVDGKKLSRDEIEELINKYSKEIKSRNFIVEFTTRDDANNSSSIILNVIVSLDSETIENKLNAIVIAFNEKQNTPTTQTPTHESVKPNNDTNVNNNENTSSSNHIIVPGTSDW